ncbi:histidine kinase [Lichenifustis flavocetrariae]|uniref:Histidine kinase n=1 Tax=Lichenifustis flavocetrariae TaxID=2949735 RepID=A0AA41Z4V9_9HYPH|nr:histidine kinase [Lichenifustis flavocetrariae]MCW6513117.1 histidine kinase [Lichenifustis flavocetrariae]
MKRQSTTSMFATAAAFALGAVIGQPLLAAVPIAASQAIIAAAGLGDLTPYRTIAADALVLVNKGDIVGAQKRGTDLETAWDKADDTMKPTGPTRWRVVEKAVDRVLNALRAPKPQTAGCASALTDLIGTIDKGGAA